MPDKVRDLAALWTQKRDEFFKLATQEAPAGGN
jgi:hypothetical protein